MKKNKRVKRLLIVLFIEVICFGGYFWYSNQNILADETDNSDVITVGNKLFKETMKIYEKTSWKCDNEALAVSISNYNDLTANFTKEFIEVFNKDNGIVIEDKIAYDSSGECGVSTALNDNYLASQLELVNKEDDIVTFKVISTYNLSDGTSESKEDDFVIKNVKGKYLVNSFSSPNLGEK